MPLSLAAERRHARILDEVALRGEASIRDLGGILGVTRETIRKDLADLAARRLVRQVRGGVTAIERREAPFAERALINPEGKRAIGRHVAALIPDGATVIVDSGSTTRAAALELARRAGLTIITNDIAIALLTRCRAETHLLGGRVTADEDSTRGFDAVEMLAGRHADFALIGVGGLDADRLFTDHARDGVALRSRMIAQAGTAILLADHTKFGRVAPFALRDAGAAARRVTDCEPPDGLEAALAALGLACDVASM